MGFYRSTYKGNTKMPNMTTRNHPNVCCEHILLKYEDDNRGTVLENYLVCCVRHTETSPLVTMTKIN